MPGMRYVECPKCGEPLLWLKVEYKAYATLSDEDIPTEEASVLFDAGTFYDTERMFCGCEGRKVSDLIEQLRNLCEGARDAKNRSKSNTSKDAAQSISEQ